MSKNKKDIRFHCLECNVAYLASSKSIGYIVTCKKCHTKFEVPDRISEKYKSRFSNLFKAKINSNFLNSFLSQAQDRFKRDKWQLNGVTANEIKNYFENDFCLIESSNSTELIKELEKKIEITVNSSQSTAKLAGKVYLTLGMIWIKLIDEEISLKESQTIRIYKIIHYFIDIDDFVPDTSVGGYLDDLYVSTFAFKRFRKNKKALILDTLKRELS